MTTANILGGILFGGVGFVAFVYGKKMGYWKPLAIGVTLMVYPYFIPDTLAMWLVGAVLTGALFVFRD